MAKKSLYRTGMSGWTYPDWRKRFYPAGLAHRLELEYASHKVRTIEINGTFYSLQKPESYLRWYDETPKDFKFSVKGPKFITHTKKLNDVEGPVANFFASGILALRDKLGPILWQLPPSLKYDHDRLESFFSLLPKTTTEAAKLGKKSDEHLKSKPYLKAGPKKKLQYALEVRHESYAENKNELIRLLKKYNIALVCADSPDQWPRFEIRTADFMYARLQGGTKLQKNGYAPKQITQWAKLAKKWSAKKYEVFVYFDKEAKLDAPFNAEALQKILK